MKKCEKVQEIARKCKKVRFFALFCTSVSSTKTRSHEEKLTAENTENAENFLDADFADCAEKYSHEKDKEELDADLLMVIGNW